MKKKREKDTILSLNLDIMNEVKANKEYINSTKGKEDLKRAIDNIKDTEISLGIKDSDYGQAMLKALHNKVNMLSGKDYYFTVNDGFEIYELPVSGIEKMDNETSPYILNRFLDNTEGEEEKIESDKDMDKERKERHFLGIKKLRKNIKKNIDLIRGKNKYEHEDYYDNIINETAYPIFQFVNFLNININI